ncbi:MAG: hypothetical protein JXA04_11800 [Gammaproteobacteria bacterium]|nr:hypothetical protein [Gammaproteobacteria bacterium]
MLKGFAKAGSSFLLISILGVFSGAFWILLGIDPKAELAKYIAKAFNDQPPIWVGNPMTQAIIFAIGVAAFVFVDWLDKKEYRKLFINTPPRDMPIHEVVDYIVNDSSIEIPDNFKGHEHDFVRMEIKEQALQGNCLLWGRKEIKNDQFSGYQFEESHNLIPTEKLKDIDFNEHINIPACDPWSQTELIDKHNDRKHQYFLFNDLWLNKKNVETVWPHKSWINRVKSVGQKRKIHPITIQQKEGVKKYLEEQERFRQIIEGE